MRHSAAVLLAALLLSGCAMGPDYARPDVAMPATWRSPTDAAASLGAMEWWQLFRDDTLQGLIRAALDENKDVRLAVARVLESRAQLGATRAVQFPQIDGKAGYRNERASRVSFPPVSDKVDTEQEFFKSSLDLSFEIDLWGRLRRATEAARAELLASEEARRNVIVTLLSDVAQAYFTLLDLDRELEIARQTLASRRESLRIVRLRFESGITSELDLRRAEGEVAGASAQIPDLERQIAQSENRISILLGRNPGPVPRGASLTELPLLPEVPAGLPSALLERRPDLRQAEQRLVAANARIGEAKAAFFPQIMLTGAFGVESIALSDLFTGPAKIWQFGPKVTIPIFNAGRLRSNLRAAEARQEQALIQYRQTIQQAFREVEDALVTHRKLREIRPDREVLVASARRSLALAELRYKDGLASYLDVLDAQRQLFAAEIELTRINRDQLTSVVQVYKALGGGWTPEASAAVLGTELQDERGEDHDVRAAR